MGNKSSTWFETNKESWFNPEIAPDRNEQPKQDPFLGYPERKERVSYLTEEQMRDARIPERQRDYCAHLYVEMMKCSRAHFPFYGNCEHEQHNYHHCQEKDIILRMKEYERERRLLKRAAKLKQQEKSEELIETA